MCAEHLEPLENTPLTTIVPIESNMFYFLNHLQKILLSTFGVNKVPERILVSGPAPRRCLAAQSTCLDPPINKLSISKTAAFVLNFKFWPPP